MRRGNLREVLPQMPRANFVVMPFDRPPTYAQIRQVAHSFDAVPSESLTNLILFCFKCNWRAVNSEKLKRWLTAFDSPERVTFAKDWDGVLLRVREAVAKSALCAAKESLPPPRPSVLDEITQITEASDELRTSSGRLSAESIAELFGISESELARLVGRSPQSLWKTPDAESLQDQLTYFEKIGRLRLVLKTREKFRKWLHTANPRLADRRPIELIRQKRWQVLADLVDDILVGSPG